MGGGGESESEGREGEGRRIQLKKNDITCAVRERETERGRERERGWEVARMKRARGETALDGLAAEQMWMKARDGQRGRMGKTEIERKAREHLY